METEEHRIAEKQAKEEDEMKQGALPCGGGGDTVVLNNNTNNYSGVINSRKLTVFRDGSGVGCIPRARGVLVLVAVARAGTTKTTATSETKWRKKKMGLRNVRKEWLASKVANETRLVIDRRTSRFRNAQQTQNGTCRVLHNRETRK